MATADFAGREARAFDLILLLVALSGGLLALQNGRQLRQLRAEYERLSTITGDLPISDASKVHVRALETGERLHFAWRVYLPANYRAVVSNASGSSSSWPAIRASSSPECGYARTNKVCCMPTPAFPGAAVVWGSETRCWQNCSTTTGTRSKWNSWGLQVLP